MTSDKQPWLGKKVKSPKSYDPNILFAIPRIQQKSPMYGFDLLRCYDFYWQTNDGQLKTNMLVIKLPLQSPNIIETKSLKLYLISIFHHPFKDANTLRKTLKSDLAQCSQSKEIEVELVDIQHSAKFISDDFYLSFHNISETLEQKQLFSQKGHDQALKLYYDTFLSYCPVTDQPDYATIVIEIKTAELNVEKLTNFLRSFQNKQDFHENCTNQIYHYLWMDISPNSLVVSAHFTRRGGIEINPHRSSNKHISAYLRFPMQ
jgi:7-cyano-7-deazaguanine reductase